MSQTFQIAITGSNIGSAIPFVAVAPAAAPSTAAPAGTIAVVFDTSTDKLWAYIGGVWKSIQFS